MRVWLSQAGEQVLLVPLVTWVAPANRGDALFLHPSIHYCDKHLDWLLEMVVGDKAYINMPRQKQIRERWNVSCDCAVARGHEAGRTIRSRSGGRLPARGANGVAGLRAEGAIAVVRGEGA